MPREDDMETIERLISRRLDGHLSPEEKLRLDRAVLRDPEARRLLEECERVDALAGAALADAIAGCPLSFDPLDLTDAPLSTPVGGYRRAWWLMPGAIAAGLLCLVMLRLNVESPVTDTPIVSDAPIVIHAVEEPSEILTQGVIGLASSGPQRTKRHTDREIIGIVGENGNIYWIEVDRTRTIRGPKRRSGAGLSSGDM